MSGEAVSGLLMMLVMDCADPVFSSGEDEGAGEVEGCAGERGSRRIEGVEWWDGVGVDGGEDRVFSEGRGVGGE